MTTQQSDAHQRFTKVTAAYQDARQELDEATSQLQRLRQQRIATMQSSRDAGERWRQAFKDAKGEPSKAVRELKHEELTLRDEAEQLEDMLGELEAHVASLKERADSLRMGHVISLYQARREESEQELADAVEAVFALPQGQQLLTALGRRAASVQREVLEDTRWLGTIGFDGHEPQHPGFLATITHEDRDKIGREVERRRRALIADVVMARLDRLDGLATSFKDDLAAPLPPLACER